MTLTGCYTAVITPLRNNEVDYEAFGKLIESQIAGGVDGVVPVGTTGESPTLSMKEHNDVIAFCAKKVNGRCKVIAGTGANATVEAIELTKEAAQNHVDACLQVTPYYNKPTQEGLYRHFSEVAEQGGLPVVLYNVPGRTGKEIELETVLRLAAHENIIAIKEAGGTLDKISAICRETGLSVLSGDDSMTLPTIAVGGKGVISVASNVVPAKVTELVHTALAGQLNEARRLHQELFPLFKDLFIETNPIPVKAALAMIGMIEESYRLPLCEMQSGNRMKLMETLKNLNLLSA